MPWYDYQCEKCGTVFEVQRAMGDTSKARCKACGSTRTSKIFTPAGVQFKGGGFYVTDSRNGATNGAAAPVDTSATDSSESNSKSDTKTEAKPATKRKPGSKKQES